MKKDPKINEDLKIANENWKRALADYQNLLRRVNDDRAQYVKLANINLLAKLLPALDIIELSASHSQDLGVQMAAKQFAEALKSEGVEVISPAIGDNFDHILHECIETVDLTPGHLENTISEISLNGYQLGDYILRPARVKVYKKTEIST